jgi:hypothetical protein
MPLKLELAINTKLLLCNIPGLVDGDLGASQLAPYSLYSSLLLTLIALVKSSALYREYDTIWDAAIGSENPMVLRS